MSTIWNIIFLLSIFCISNSIICAFPSPDEANDKQEEDASNSSEGDSEKELGTVSPTEMEKLKEEIIENQEENAEKFGLPLTSSPKEVEEFLKEEEKEYGKELPEKIEEGLKEADDFKNFVHFLALFDKIESETSDSEDIEEIEKSPEEMKEMKAEVFKLTNELNERQGLPKVSHEEFDKVWNKKKEEYGKKFPGKVEKLIVLLTDNEEKEEPTTPVKISETVTEASTSPSDISKGESPKGAFVVRSAKEKICILAKFHSEITITYPGKTSEQKIEVTIPPNGNTKGKCGGPNRLPSLQISWGKFNFALMFNKTSEDSWGVTSVELTYDTSEPIFDGAVNRVKITAKSTEVNLFETPFGKSYFCPAQEVILLYSENQHVATVRLKEVHIQPYDVEDGKFSTSHRCNQVVIGGPDEEPFVQDETIPLAVGCTLALITLMILVGFSVHRAYHAAKVDYNNME